MPYLTDIVAALAEQDIRIGVTLGVDGTVITGTTAPVMDYYRWFSEGAARSLGVKLTMSEEDEETVQAAADKEGGWRSDAYEESEHREYPTICLRDAQIHGGLPADVRNGVVLRWGEYPFLLVQAAAVSAMTVGIGTTSAG